MGLFARKERVKCHKVQLYQCTFLANLVSYQGNLTLSCYFLIFVAQHNTKYSFVLNSMKAFDKSKLYLLTHDTWWSTGQRLCLSLY